MICLAQVRLSLLLLTLILTLALFNSASGEEEPASHFVYLPIVNWPLPSVENIAEPLLIDGEKGRIYAIAEVDGARQTVVLSTADGRYLDSYPYAGRLALDRIYNKLLIDQGYEGVVLLDSTNGAWLGVIDPPRAGHALADPQVNPNQGIAYLFRGNTVYTLDVQNLQIADSRTIFVPFRYCANSVSPASINRSFYDIISNTLYLSFTTYACIPHATDTIHIYDPVSWHKWSEYSTPYHYQAVPFAANLYGLSEASVGTHAYWAISRTEEWYGTNGGNSDLVNMAGNVVDYSRGLLYEAVWEVSLGDTQVVKQIRVSDTDNRQIVTIVNYDRPPIQDARLAGHDPQTDQLYFLDQGVLLVVPTSSILPVSDPPVGDPSMGGPSMG